MTGPGKRTPRAVAAFARTPRLQTMMPVLVVVVAIAAYVNALHNGFVLDDEGVLTHNDIVHSLSGMWRAFVTPYWPNGAGQYRPLVIASFSAEWAVFRGAPAGFHAINVAWHAGASLLAYAVLRRWLSFGGAAIAALLFAVHPVHVEAVANVVGRAELMAACGVLATVVLHARRSPWAVVAFAAAMLSKEHAIVAPLLVLGADMRTVRVAKESGPERPVRRVVPLYVGYAVVIVAWAGAATYALHGVQFAAVAPLWADMDAPGRLLTMLGIVPEWIRLWFFPLALSVDYSPRVLPAWPDNVVPAVVGAIVLIAACAAVFAARRRAPGVVVALGWMFVAMLPVANLIIPTGVVLAERTLYLSSVGAVMLVGFAVQWSAQRTTSLVMTLATLLVLAGGARTLTRNEVWRSNRALFLDVAEHHPEASWAHASLARVYAGNGGFPQAAEEYTRSLALFGKDPAVWSEAILAAVRANEPALADSLVGEALAHVRGGYLVHMARAYAALSQHRYSESLRAARAASSAEPDSAPPRYFAALAWVGLAFPDSAGRELDRIPANHPLRAAADSLQRSLPQRGQ